MKTQIDFITNRAKTTRHAQENLQSSWMWNETTLDQWDSEIDELHKMQEVCSSAEFTRNSARAALDAGLLELHRLTMQFLAMAKFHFRNDLPKLEAISRLTSNGLGRRAIAQEALDVESAWQKVAEWAPTEANTFTAFQALRKQCTELDAAFIAAFSAWRTQSEILKQKAAALNKSTIAWYAAATRIFPSGTAEGDMVRRSIPTRYTTPVQAKTPAPAPAPQQAAVM